MAVSYSDFMSARQRANPAIYGLSLAALHAGSTSGDTGLTETQGARAFLTVYNTLAGLNPGRGETLQADTARVWDSLSATARRAIAINPEIAAPYIMEAVRNDPTLAARAAAAGSSSDATARSGADGAGTVPLAWRASVQSGARYREMDDRVWDPTTGAEGLNDRNFPAAFRAAGLNVATAQALLRMGYNPLQITNAGQDARALGLDTRDQRTVLNFAEVDRLDPEGRERRRQIFERFQRWSQENGEELRRLQTAVDSARTDTERTEAQRRMQQFVRQGEDQTGVSQERARFPQTARDLQHPNRPTGSEAVGDIARSIVAQQTGVTRQLTLSAATTDGSRDRGRSVEQGSTPAQIARVRDQNQRVADARSVDDNSDIIARLRQRRGLAPVSDGAPTPPLGPAGTEPTQPIAEGPSPSRPGASAAATRTSSPSPT